jgi:peptidoglycan/LPS O-acetylase OafA/YrhL
MVLFFEPFANKIELMQLSKSLISVPIRTCYLYTETFLTISGLLVSYSIIGRLQRGQKVNVVREILSRYFRFMPPMVALVIFATFILPKLGNGPQWNMLITFQSEICKRNGWRNLLMIQNYFGFEDICMTHTHHIGTDFWLFIMGIFLVLLMFKHPKLGSLVIVVIAGLVSWRNYQIAIGGNLNLYTYFGMP